MLDILGNYKKIGIVTHINPDPDAIGSGLALMKTINLNFNTEVNFFINEPLTDYFNFFDVNEITISDADNCYDVDLLISVDCGSIDRVAKEGIVYKDLINIDHHVSKNDFGISNFINTEACSTAEILFDIFENNNFKINSEIALCLYYGFMSDTGNLSWGKVNSTTLNKLAKLKLYGVDHELVSKNLFGRRKIKNLRLMGYVLQNFILIERLKFCYFVMNKDVLETLDAKYEDCEGIIELMKTLEGYDIFLLLKEHRSEFKGSLRSNNVDVNKLASIFGGGGHKKAAGFSISESSDKIINRIKIYLGNL